MIIGKSLADYNPELCKSWHPQKNGSLSPNKVAPYSNKRVWWKCEKGHEWQATISNRTGKNKTGCPYCSGRKSTADRNLTLLFPELIKEWHYQKNVDLNPDYISPYSHKKVWWKCEKGHEWQTRIVYRTRQKSGCPYCSGRVAGADNSLEILYPNLAKEWHPTKNDTLTPSDVRPGTDRKVWWLCDKGHSWQASICNRTYETQATGCPYCSGRYATKDNNLALLFPELLDEWNFDKNAPLRPDKLKPGSNRKVWWKCKKGHEWKTSPNKRTGTDKTGCPHCQPQTSRLEIRILCELMYLFDEVKWREKINGFEVDIYLPKYSIGIEVDGYFWHVNREEKDKLKGVELSNRDINLFRLREDKLKIIDKTDIFFRNNEEDLLIIHRLFQHLLNNVQFDVQDQSAINKYLKVNLIQNDTEYQRFLSFLPSPPPEYSFASLNKDLILEWHYEKNAPLKPENFTPGVRTKLWWKCDKGHEWQASIVSRAKGTGCPYCAGKKVSNDNNLSIRFPNLVNEWNFEKNMPLMPDKVYYGSTKKVWWKCSKGHEWQASISNRTRNQSGCLYCAGKLVNTDNCLQTHYPDLANEWHPTKNGSLNPKDVIPGSHKKAWWICDRGHEWEAVIDNRTRHNSGCPYCAGQKVSSNNNLLFSFPEIAKEWHFKKNTPLKPDDYAAHSHKKVWWRCIAKNHEWEATISNRTGKNKTGCPYCSGRKSTADRNLTLLFPELIKEWHYQENVDLNPDYISPYSHKKVWWKCEKGHKWKTGVSYRTKQKSGCPYCSGKKM